MDLKLNARQISKVARRADILIKRMDAGLYYRWDLGYNELLKEADLDRALRERRKSTQH